MENHEYYYLAKLNLLPDAKDRVRTFSKIKKGMKIHISGVCGKAMASIACMLKDSGFDVTGSDSAFFPPMSDVLKQNNIKCFPYSKNNLKGKDIVIVGNTMAHSAVEVLEAREKSLPMISGSEAVAQIFANKRSLVVAGTHGKTTTSALLTHVFKESKKDPAYMIGGVFQNSTESYSIGNKKSKYVIYEGDEYNCAFFDRGPKFLRYNPSSAILTSIEHDHFDLYPTFEDYKQAFQFLIEILPKNGNLVVHEEAAKYLDIKKCKAKVCTYSSRKSADFQYKINKIDSGGTYFSVYYKNIKTDLFVPLFGEYNIANATSVFALSLLEKLSQKSVIEGISTFPGTKERQEVLGTKNNNILVIRDYAHHPTAVTFTLKGLKESNKERRFISIFEPRSASSKMKVFEERYALALKNSDLSIIISPPVSNNSNSIDVSKTAEIINKNKPKSCYTAKDCEEALGILNKIVKNDDICLFMSSGDMAGIPFEFLNSK